MRRNIIGIVLSVRPEYIAKIFSGEKKCEYRRTAPQKIFNPGYGAECKIYLYETAPASMVVGECDVNGYWWGSAEYVWAETHRIGGISAEKYFDYAHRGGNKYLTAIRIENIKKYQQPKALRDFGIKKAPQSFSYVKENL